MKEDETVKCVHTCRCFRFGIINVIYAQHEYGKSVYGLRGAGTAMKLIFHGAQGHINSPDDHEKYIAPENSEPVVGERGSQLTTIGAGSVVLNHKR